MHRKFALNCGIRFFTPESFFEDKPQKIPKSLDYSPTTLMKARLIKSKLTLDGDSLYMVVGLPRIGKTTFIKTLGYHVISTFTADIPNESGIYILDGDYRNVFTRAPVISEMKKIGRKVCALYFSCNNFIEWSHLYMYFSITNKLSIESETFRENVFSKFSRPRLGEGFESIIEIHDHLIHYDEAVGDLYLI